MEDVEGGEKTHPDNAASEQIPYSNNNSIYKEIYQI